MIKIRLDIEDGVISSISIMGDFFLHPEDTISTIEQNLLGIQLELKVLTSKITRTLQESDATLIGANADDIAQAIMIALETE